MAEVNHRSIFAELLLHQVRYICNDGRDLFLIGIVLMEWGEIRRLLMRFNFSQLSFNNHITALQVELTYLIPKVIGLHKLDPMADSFSDRE